MNCSVLWLRRDLRRADHPALAAAAADAAVVPLYVADPRMRRYPHRAAGLARVLAGLHEEYEGALVLRTGRPTDVVAALAREVGATAVHVTQDFTPAGRAADDAVADALGDVPLVATGSPYAVAPGTVLNRAGAPFRIFTPFARTWREHGWQAIAGEPPGLRFVRDVDSEPLPSPPSGTPGLLVAEEETRRWWAEFSAEGLERYGDGRDRPDLDATSRLSAALRWGTIHPSTLLATLRTRTDPGAHRFVTELAWREFCGDVLWHNPRSAGQDLYPLGIEYADTEDSAVAGQVEAWKQGRTGYPFVDAGMRQLTATGWMHNRVRMVTASFLTKHLNVWWPVGARHFAENLADYDLASNSHNWQWVAGTGTDPSPFFRIFNPVSQGLKFDPGGDYVRRWIPELRHLSGARAHRPWQHADGYAHGYPRRIVDHDDARAAALARYDRASR